MALRRTKVELLLLVAEHLRHWRLKVDLRRASVGLLLVTDKEASCTFLLLYSQQFPNVNRMSSNEYSIQRVQAGNGTSGTSNGGNGLDLNAALNFVVSLTSTQLSSSSDDRR